MRGREFLDVAHHLGGVRDEAILRTRIGRAYYAAYLEARAFCEIALDYRRTRSSREHQEVTRLIAVVAPTVSSDLYFLRGFRNAADYDLDLSYETIRRNDRDAVDLATAIIARLDELTAMATPHA